MTIQGITALDALCRLLFATARIVLILLTAGSSLCAGDFFGQFWPEADFYLRTGKKIRTDS